MTDSVDRRRSSPTNAGHACGPAPNSLRYNDWRKLPVASAESFSPTLPVSVIVSYFEQPAALQALLVGLEHQTYPRSLFDVIVVDDGSATPLKRPVSTLDIRVIRQQNRGFGLARARNNGARAAAGGILLFLDGDVVPHPDLLTAHARWHHAVADALTLGFRACPADSVSDDELRKRPEALVERYGESDFDLCRQLRLSHSDDLTTRHDWLFLAMVGANFSMHKRFYDCLGGCDESFTRYGGEDTELAYRAYNCGGVLIPVREARVWHPPASARELYGKHGQMQAQRLKLSNLIPHRQYRNERKNRIFSVPRHVVTFQAGPGPATGLAEAVDDILERGPGDLVVRIEAGSLSHGDLASLREYFDADPRVRVAPSRSALDEFPASPLHITVPAAGVTDGETIAHLVKKLGLAVWASLPLPDGQTATVGRAWALQRARRTGLPVTAFGAALNLPRRKPRDKGADVTARSEEAGRRLSLFKGLRRVAAETRHVRSLRTARAFLVWMVRGALRTVRPVRPARRNDPSSR